MGKFKKYFQATGFIIGLLLGAVWQKNMEAKQDNVGSRLWNIGTNKLPKIIKLCAEGAIACYASYIAFEWAVESLPDAQRLVDWKKPFMPIFKRIMYNGCIIIGLGNLAYLSGNACLNNLESL